MDKLKLIHRCLDEFIDPSYLEIGLDKLKNFNLVKCNYKVGVDPNIYESDIIYDDKNIIHQSKSDKFFESNENIFHVIFIDGLHTYEQSLKDVKNSLRCLSTFGYIILHDCIPPTELSANPTHISGEWCGEVYKTIIWLRSNLDYINVHVLYADYGLGIITFGNPDNMLNFTDKEIDLLTYADFFEDKFRLLNIG